MEDKDCERIADLVTEKLMYSGMVVVSRDVAELGLHFKQEQAKQMQKTSISLYKCAEFRLLGGVKSISTLKNMVKDGRIKKQWVHPSTKGTMILTQGIREYNRKN